MAWTFLVYLQAALGGTLLSTTRPLPLQEDLSSSTDLPVPLSSSTSSSPFVVDTTSTGKLCLQLHDVFIALLLVLLILMTIFGNVLVVLSVFVYKRMRTFTNILLTSLATADLLVGTIVMPLSLLDLLHSHKWPFGRLLCSIWATTDVLLCTASILNLCVISLDRYFAITSPLKYPRTRSRKMAAGLLSAVWLLSIVVCSPPWFVPSWNLFTHEGNAPKTKTVNGTEVEDPDAPFVCAYSTSPAYRIYSALGSFYFPLLVMLSVYFKIFRVASEREALMRQSVGTCRLSNRIVKTQAKNNRHNPRNQSKRLAAPHYPFTNGELRECASAPISRNRLQRESGSCGARANYSVRPTTHTNNRHTDVRRMESRPDSSDAEDSPPAHDSGELSQGNSGVSNGVTSPKRYKNTVTDTTHGEVSEGSSSTRGLERECHSLADLADRTMQSAPRRKNTEVRADEVNSGSGRKTQTRLQPQNLMAKAHEHYQMCGPGKAVRGSKEKMVYLRERKALKTIGIVVLGFIVCWMPFFILYLLEVFITNTKSIPMFKVLSEFFLWLGYSNSVLNPIIYTMYNGDFRRCFRDLLSFGCIQHHRRTMSVKKLHQQSTIF